MEYRMSYMVESLDADGQRCREIDARLSDQG